MDELAAQTEESKGPSCCLASATAKKLVTTAMPGKCPVPHTCLVVDGGTPQGGVSTGEGHDQESELCHKSRPGLMSERPWREAQSGDGAPTWNGEAVWSGDASLQQTSVLGPGDGCGMEPEGNANEIQGVVADCYKGRPGSGGSSLGSMSHLQRGTGTGSTSVLPRTGTQSQIDKKPLSGRAPRHPPEQTTFQGHIRCGEMDEDGRREGIPGVSATETVAAPHSRLGSLVSRVSWMVQDAGRLLWSSRTVLQQVREEGLRHFGARHVVSLVRESNVVSVVKDSQVFALVKGSFVFSLLKDSQILSTVKALPFPRHIKMETTQQPQPEIINPDTTRLSDLSPTQTFCKAEDLPDEGSEIPERIQTRNRSQETSGIRVEQKDNAKTDQSACDDEKEMDLRTMLDRGDVQIFSQRLIKFPNSLLNLQSLPLPDLLNVVNSLICTPAIPAQKIVTLLWVNVAKCSQPEPRPGLLILAESGLYTLTSDSGPLLWFHHLPLQQLKEVHVGLAGQSLCFMDSTERSTLGVYTHNHKMTRELCCAILGAMCPGDIRVSQHPLLHGDLMEMSLKWETCVPDLLLDAGFKVCCHFQKSLAALVYLIHCNMDKESSPLGEVQLAMYTSVRVCMSPSVLSESIAQLFLTHTHIGLVQEEVVFPPTSSCASAQRRRRPQFHHLTVRQRSGVRCVLVHDEDERGAVRLDVILANARGRGHPESVTEAATPPAQASNSSPHAEVWKLTFSCSTEAACLINHLSNV